MKEQERTEEMTCDRCGDALDVAEICTFCQGEFCSKCLVEHVCLTAEPRVWSLPAEPGPEVTRLRVAGAGGTEWKRAPRGNRWEVADGTGNHLARYTFLELLQFAGPLTDATPTKETK